MLLVGCSGALEFLFGSIGSGLPLEPRFLLRWEALSVRLSGTTQRAAVQEPSFASLGSGYLLLPLTLR